MSRARVRSVALALVFAAAGCGILRRHPTVAPAAQIDLNTASLRAIERLPGVTPSMARRIVDGRPYDDPRDLVDRGILTERELGRIADVVVTRGAR